MCMSQVLDVPRLLAQLRLSQSRPRLTAFKQLANSINQLMQLQQMVAALAPAAAAEAAAIGDAEGTAAAGGYMPQRPRGAGNGRASAVSCGTYPVSSAIAGCTMYNLPCASSC